MLLFWWASSAFILLAANKLAGTWGLVLLGLPGSYVWFGILIAIVTRVSR